jgi:hypothetical protein
MRLREWPIEWMPRVNVNWPNAASGPEAPNKKMPVTHSRITGRQGKHREKVTRRDRQGIAAAAATASLRQRGPHFNVCATARAARLTV